MGRTLQILGLADIILISRRMVEEFGGLFVGDDNMATPGSLEYTLEEIQGSVFGHRLWSERARHHYRLCQKPYLKTSGP